MPALYGNQPDADWTWYTGGIGHLNQGTRFQVTASGELSQAGWFRAGDLGSYSWLGIWDDTGELLWESTAPVDSGPYGWRWTPISPPLAVSTGTTYTVSGYVNGVVGVPGCNTPASRASPPAPFLLDDGMQFQATGVHVYPTSLVTSQFVPLSVFFTAPPEPVPGPGEGDPTTTGDLNSWLSSDPDVQTHEADGLPWITRQYVQSISDVIGGLADAATSTGTLMGRTAELLGRTAQILLRLPADILEALEVAANSTLSWFGGGPKPAGVPTIPDRMDDFAGRLLDLQVQLADVGAITERLWHRTETTDWLISVPGADWELIDTLEWSGSFGWNQPADCYVLHITDFPPTWDQELVDGYLWLPRAGWWAPLTGTLPHERHFADLEFQVLHALPMRCEGILYRSSPGFAGTLEAWRRPTPPPSGDLPF